MSAVFAFNVKALSTSLLVYVVNLSDLNNRLLRTSVFVNVVTLSALNNRLLSTSVFVYVVNWLDFLDNAVSTSVCVLKFGADILPGLVRVYRLLFNLMLLYFLLLTRRFLFLLSYHELHLMILMN